MHEPTFWVAKFSKPMTASNIPSFGTFLFGESSFSRTGAVAGHVDKARRRTDALEKSRLIPPIDDCIGDRRRLAPRTKYNRVSKEFLSLFVSGAARMATVDKQARDDYAARPRPRTRIRSRAGPGAPNPDVGIRLRHPVRGMTLGDMPS